MSFETYHLIWKTEENGKVLRPQKEGAAFTFSLEPKSNKRYRLFTVGETAQFYQWKNEPDGPAQYAQLDDSLDTEHAVNRHYCLNFSSEEPVSYVKRIHKFILWPPVLSFLTVHTLGDELEMGVSAAAEGIRIQEGGYLRMRAEVRYHREGYAPASVAFAPDLIYQIDLPEGTYPMTAFTKAITIPKEQTASVAIWIEGKSYQGSLYLEQPFLRGGGYDLLPDFSLSVPNKHHYQWAGQYLSKKEWPAFRLTLNGQPLFQGEVFERSHDGSEWEVELPAALLREQNTLTYELISDFHDPLPYTIREVGIIEQEGGAVALISAARRAKVGKKAILLLRTEKPDTQVTLTVDPAHFEAPTSYTFGESGLHAIPLLCKAAGFGLPFTLTFEGGSIRGAVEAVFQGEDDGVRVGTGDMIYIHQNLTDMEEYLSWYFSEEIGELITIRPTFRWSGSKTVDPEVWRVFTRLMAEADLRYVLMLDGREAPGLAANPSEAMLAGEGYLGSQSHEVDGALAYWGASRFDNNLANLQIHNLWMRICDEEPAHVFSRWTSANLLMGDDEGRLFRHRNPNRPRDMKDGAEYMMERLRALQLRETRHTGPSALFKYFIQAGYSWVGAETMYTSMEPILSFLRGTKKGYQLPAVGVHHALQWCMDRHYTEESFRRYRLALYTAYLLGADDLNTEEGLWRIENYHNCYHRFSPCLQGYLKEHRDFSRFLATHTRKGTFHTPNAFLHGRYDGFIQSSGRCLTWGWRAENGMPSGFFPEAEKSWALFKPFYPQCRPAGGVPNPFTKDSATGAYSGTPLGQVDTVPVECAEKLDSYRFAAFIGYNCAEEQDLAQLKRYVEQGGRLLLTRAHLSHTTKLSDLRAGNFAFREMPLSFTEGEPQWVETTYQGVPLTLCKNIQTEGLLSAIPADDGTPLLCRYRLGAGEVLLFNTPAYPAHEAIRALYEETLRACAEEEAAKEPFWAKCGSDVEFSVYEAEDGSRSLYLLAVDLFNDPAALRSATLMADGYEYPISVPFGVMIKCVWQAGAILYPHSENAEVLEIRENSALVQGTGSATFTLCRGGKSRDIEVDFTDAVMEITF